MANTIRLKRASGSDPGASDLVTGELAVRTDSGKLFTKKDDNSVAEIGGSATVADGAITTAKIANDAVTNDKLADDAVDTAQIADDAVQSAQIAANAVTASEIANTTIIEGNIADQAVTSAKIANGTIDNVDISTNAGITGGKLANSTVAYEKIQNVSASDRLLGRDSTGAGVIEEIAPSAVRTMLNVADGATNVTNTNQLTNGAGFITATLTNEQVQDIVGGMLTGNTETGITVTYQDSDGTIDFVVGTLNQDTTGNAATATALETARNIGGVSFDGTGNINLPGVNTSGNQDTSGNAATATALATARTIAGVSFDGTGNISLNNNAITNGAGYITATLTNEQVQDIVGGMVSGNTESGISVTYQDSDGTLDFSVSSQTDENFTTTLKNKLDGIAASATNVTNTNQLTNGAGFITSADGGNAATLDSIDSSQFLRSDTSDNASGLLTLDSGVSFGANAICPAALSSLSDGSTITIPFDSGVHHSVTLGGNRTFGDPGNTGNAVGQSGSIFITQDGTGSRTASFHSDFKFAGGTAPTLSTAANAIDRIDYVIKAANVVHCAFTADVK
jgi:hypothetical protein